VFRVQGLGFEGYSKPQKTLRPKWNKSSQWGTDGSAIGRLCYADGSARTDGSAMRTALPARTALLCGRLCPLGLVPARLIRAASSQDLGFRS